MLSMPQWHFGPFRLDPTNACLWRGDQVLELRPKVFAVLEYLVRHAGQLVTKEALLETVWPETAVSDTVLKACIRQIRQVLGETVRAPQCVVTVHRLGYRFVAPVTASGRPLTATEPATADSLPSRAVLRRLRTAGPGPLLIERDSMLHQLHAWLADVARGQRRVVFVRGDPGLGKTAVVAAFTAQVMAAGAARVAWGQCIERYGAGEVYMPVLEALGQLCRGPGGRDMVAVLRQHAPTWLVQMPWLLSPADRELLQQELRGTTRDRMLRELAEAISTLTAETPLILVLEDLHWSDHATLDVLTVLARRRERAQLLLVGTYRPVDAHTHPLHMLVQDLQVHGYCTELSPGLLSAPAVAAYLVARVPGCVLPAALVQQIYERTEGNPLFLVQVVEHLITQGVLVAQDGHWHVRAAAGEVTVAVPDSLWQMLAQQLDRLSPEEQQLVEAGSVQGVEFTAAVVAAGLTAEVGQVATRCATLARQGRVLRQVGVVEWPDGTLTTRYAFQHALYQQVAYERLGAPQRVRLHRRIGERLGQAYGPRTAEIAAELAMHFERGRDYYRAIQCFRQAAEIALQRYAHREAIDLLSRSLALLSRLPETPERTQQELQVQLELGAPLMAVKGQASPEVERVYGRAYALCGQVEETAQLLPVLAGLRRFYAVRGAHQAAWELGERLLTLAQRFHEPAFLSEAHRGLGTTLLFAGQFHQALAHLQQGMALYRPGALRVADVLGNPQVSCLLFAARALWCLGYPDRALTRGLEALALMQDQAHPYGTVWGQSFVADLYLLRGEYHAAFRLIDVSLARATTQGVPYWMGRGTVMHGLALAKQGDSSAGIAQMRQGMAAMQGTGAALNRSYFLAQLAEAYLSIGQSDAALAILAEAMAMIERTGEHSWAAEVYRLMGEAWLVQNSAQPATSSNTLGAAVEYLQQALDVARRQHARSLELRAALSLSRLWQQHGKQESARQLLADVYGWFTEGFDTVDLRAAAALLKALG